MVPFCARSHNVAKDFMKSHRSFHVSMIVKILWSRIGVFMSLWLCIFRFILKCINIQYCEIESWYLKLISFSDNPFVVQGTVMSDIWDQCNTRLRPKICEKYFHLFPQKIYKLRQLSLSQFVWFWWKCVYFSILNDKLHNYVFLT